MADVLTYDYDRLAAEYELLALRHFAIGVTASGLPMCDLITLAIFVRLFAAFWKRG